MTEKSDRFTKYAHSTLAFAEQEMQRLNHQYIGTEHLLLGLIQAEESLATKVLVELGLDLKQARERVLQVITPADDANGG